MDDEAKESNGGGDDDTDDDGDTPDVRATVIVLCMHTTTKDEGQYWMVV